MSFASILNIPLVLPIWFIGMFVLGTFLFGYLYINAWWQNMKWNPEGKIFVKARKQGYPVLMIHAMSGFFRFILGEKDKKGDPIFKFDKNSHEGIRFDTRLQNGSVSKCYTVGGLEIYNYATNSPTALSAKNAVAMDTILEHIRKNYPQLKYLPDQLILEYTSRNRDELPHDCKNLAELYDIDVIPSEAEIIEFKSVISQQIQEELTKNNEDRGPTDDEINEMYEANKKAFVIDYRTKYLVRIFMKIQDEVVNLPIDNNRFFSFAEAFQNIASAWTAVDIQTIMQLLESIAKMNSDLDKKWLWMMLIGSGMFLVMAAIAYLLISRSQ